MKKVLSPITILFLLLFSPVHLLNAQHRKLPDAPIITKNKITSLKVRHCSDLTCINSTLCDVYNFTQTGKLKSTFTIRTPKTNATYFTTVSDSENYKVYYYNNLDNLNEIQSRNSFSICFDLEKSDTEVSRYTYRKDGKLNSQTIINSCCTLKIKYEYPTDTTSKINISEEYCNEPIRKRKQIHYYADNKIIKEVIDDMQYYTYQYNKIGDLTDIKHIQKTKSGTMITHQQFSYNPDGTLHEEIVQQYYEKAVNTKYLDSRYVYTYSGDQIRMITFTSFGKISEYLIYNYYQ